MERIPGLHYSPPPDSDSGPAKSLEQVQARHRKELRDLQNRITSKKKNATNRTRKGVNDECANMERDLREKQALEIAALSGGAGGHADDGSDDHDTTEPDATEGIMNGTDDTTTSTLATKLEASTISDSPADHQTQKQQHQQHHHHQQQQQQQQQQTPAKKRNRQQERLARRAAEREAAMAAAEEEAANMVDRRQIESAYMQDQMQAHSLAEQQIRPDGHCLFAAVADQLRVHGIALGGADDPATGGEPDYKVVRRRAADYVEEHANDFTPFLEVPVEKHAATIRDTAEWGGHVELLALARAYAVEIKVVQQEGRTESIGEGERTLWLAFYRHGYGLGEHYNSLRAKGD